jgi:DNA-binding LacI/PurR family transcriptional regulator
MVDQDRDRQPGAGRHRPAESHHPLPRARDTHMSAAVRPKRPVVMADVARLAGVSQQTVSRVINDSPNLRPETRQRVQEAIDRLGYRPNTSARALVRGHTEAIGLINTGLTYFGPTSIRHSIEEAAGASGLFVSSVTLPSLTRASLDASVEHLLRQLVEGIIIIAGQDDALEIAKSRNVSIPIVLVEGDLTRAEWTVGVNQTGGARLATRHLLDLGHHEIVHLAGPQDWSEARARLEGWRAEMAKAGLRPPEPIIGDWSAEFGNSAGSRVAVDRNITAVFAANDQIAIGLLSALHQAGRRIPEDVSVVGFDNQPETAYLIPPLTTVRQDFPELGRRAVDTLILAIAGSPAPEQDLIAPELVVRSSTASRPK